MLDPSSTDEFWCPLGDTRVPGAKPPKAMTSEDSEALSRFGAGEWISDAQIDQLESLGLLEKVFGQALLTRLGRTTLGIDS
jgi:hypothetical protein